MANDSLRTLANLGKGIIGSICVAVPISVLSQKLIMPDAPTAESAIVAMASVAIAYGLKLMNADAKNANGKIEQAADGVNALIDGVHNLGHRMFHHGAVKTH